VFDKLIDVLVSVVHWFKFWAICDAEHAGFVRKFGQPVRDLRPGYNWLWPSIERAELVDMRVWADVLPPQSLRTLDGVDLVVQLMVSHRVSDPRKFALTVYDAHNNLQDLAAGELGAGVMAATAEEVYTGVVLKKVRKKVVSAAKAWGLSVVNVQLTDCCPAPAYRVFGVGALGAPNGN